MISENIDSKKQALNAFISLYSSESRIFETPLEWIGLWLAEAIQASFNTSASNKESHLKKYENEEYFGHYEAGHIDTLFYLANHLVQTDCTEIIQFHTHVIKLNNTPIYQDGSYYWVKLKAAHLDEEESPWKVGQYWEEDDESPEGFFLCSHIPRYGVEQFDEIGEEIKERKIMNKLEEDAARQRLYQKRKMKEGYQRISIWIKKEWRPKLDELIAKWKDDEMQKKINAKIPMLKKKLSGTKKGSH